MNRIVAAAKRLVLLLLPAIMGLAQQPQVTIGVVFDGPGRRPGQSAELIEREITSLLTGQYAVRFPEEKRLDGQWTASRVRSALDQLLADPEVDVVITVGALGSLEAGTRGPLPKPVLATTVLFPETFGIPYQERTRRGGGSGTPERYHVSGTENFSYTVFSTDFPREISAFRELTPFRRLVVLSTAALVETVPELVEVFNRRVASLDLEITHVPVGDSVADAMARIPADAEAVYVTPLVHLSDDQFEQLVAELIERRMPSFSLWGRSEVVTGLLTSLAVEREFGRTARRTAVNLHRILLGESAAELPVDLRQRQRLAINMTTARAVGVYPSWALMTEAELIGQPERQEVRRLSLAAVVREAEQVNLDLAAADRAVAAGEQQVREARSNLLPQLEVSARQVVIDKDRAAASFGSSGQFQTAGSVGLKQLIYSEGARAGYDIEQSLQRSREQERGQLRLDVVLEAAQSYLNVLRAKTFERIQRENLERTRLNLELAVSRREVGTAGPGEVYRWEAEIANNRRDLIASNAQRNQAEIALNRILNRSSEEPFETAEVDLNDTELGLNYEQLRPFIDNQQTFRLFRRFLAARALELAPELARLDAAVNAQERALLASKRAFYVPTIGVQAAMTGIHNAGTGSEGFSFEGSAPDGLNLPMPGNFDWNIAASASLPLFSGGALRARKSRAQIELDELTLQREATRQRVEQRVRSAMHQSLASWAAIDLSRQAAEAASNNFNLVYDSYAEGLVDIIRVVDAQNQALVADLIAANAVYDFLVDLMNMQRAGGEFSLFRSREERQALLEQMERFYAQEDLRSAGSRYAGVLVTNLLLAIVFLGMVGCNGEEPVVEAAPPRPVRYVTTFAVGGARARTFSGAAKAGTETNLSFKVQGTLESLNVNPGDTVRKGLLIAEIDPTDYEIQVQRAEASLAQAQAQAVSAQADLERVRNLYERNNAPQSDYDSALARAESARANVRSIEKQLEQAKLQVSYCDLQSPVSGSVTEVPVEVNENVRAGQAIVVVNAGQFPEVEVALPEALISEVRPGMRIESVTFGALRGRSFAGQITEVAVAPPQGLTTYPVTVRLDAADRRILPGMAAEVSFLFGSNGRPPRHILPPHAVGEDRQGRFVYVLKPAGEGLGAVERRAVVVGALVSSDRFGDGIEVLEGLQDGERVVTAGISKIADGQTVRLNEEQQG